MTRQPKRARMRDAKLQVEFGKQLAADKLSCFATGHTWKKHVRDVFNLSRERADELIRIAVGRTTVEEARTTKRKSMQASRLRRSKKLLNEPAKIRFLNCVRLSNEKCLQAKLCIAGKGFPPKDTSEIRAATLKMIDAWQKTLEELK